MSKRKLGAMQEEPATSVAAAPAPLRIVESSTQDAPESTDAADAAWMLPDIHRRLCRIEQLFELVPLLLAQVVDPTHVSIETAAQVLRVSTKTIRRRIKAGALRLQVIPGTRISAIDISQLYDQWIDLRTARRAFERECHARRS